MEMLLVYLWLRIDPFKDLLVLASILSVLIGSVCALAAAIYSSEGCAKEASSFSLWRSRCILVAAVVVPLAVFVPSKTDIAILAGASLAVDMAKTPEAQKVGYLIRGKVNEILDAELAKMTKPREAKP